MKPQRFSQWQGWGITILRAVVGSVFVMHGGQKLFSYGFRGVAQFLGHAGVPASMLSGVVVTAVECLGGLALAGPGEASMDMALARHGIWPSFPYARGA